MEEGKTLRLRTAAPVCFCRRLDHEQRELPLCLREG